MSYRRTPSDRAATQQWAEFCAHNESLIQTASLPPSVTDTEDRWSDFLMHGWVDHHDDPYHFSVEQLAGSGYAALLQLATRYFEAGYPYFTPISLQPEDQRRLAERFGPQEYA